MYSVICKNFIFEKNIAFTFDEKIYKKYRNAI